MIHIYIKGTNDKTIVLFHGTGGNENDLLSIGKIIDPQANVLSLRGDVLEYGMPRFLRGNLWSLLIMKVWLKRHIILETL